MLGTFCFGELLYCGPISGFSSQLEDQVSHRLFLRKDPARNDALKVPDLSHFGVNWFNIYKLYLSLLAETVRDARFSSKMGQLGPE